MAEIIAVKLATRILGKLFSLAAEEVIQAWNLTENIDHLGKKMEMVHALLCDAETKQIQMNTLQVWLEELKGVALEADFLMDELAYQASRRKANNHSRVRKLISFPKHSLYYARKIKNINMSLDKVSKLAKDLGLSPASDIDAIAQQALEIRHTSPFLGNSKIIGRDCDVSNVVQMVCQNNEKDLPVIVIVGMGGLGKTTLARQVYNHPEMISLFQERVWVTVSDDFGLIRISNEMIQSLFKENPQLTNSEAIIGKLREKLMGKRFLLVLDDVWNEDPKKWNDMERLLLGVESARGSKVLVTARNNKVAEAMQTPFCHQLAGLSEDDSLALFTQRAFADGGVFETKELEAIGRRMVKKCGGLPLAIHALGGLLYSQRSEQDWLSIEYNKTWVSDDVVPCLRITYEHLSPLSLKQCFSYCSIFSKNFDINKNELIQIWMALGWLLPPRGNDIAMEDVGNEYFNTLLWNSLLQDVEVDDHGNIESCKMHDLTHDLALEVSTKYSTTIKVSDTVIDVSEAIYVKLEVVEGIRPNTLKGNVGRVEALHIDNVVLGNLLSKFEHLTVLVLSSTEGNNQVEISEISKLKYLRYLDISKLSYVRKLSDFITTLYNLQTLRVYWLEELPKLFGNLINMRHVHFTAYSSSAWFGSKCCWFVGIERMTCLQTLPYFAVSQDKGCHLKELESLDKLGGALRISGLCNVANMEDASKARLCRKTNMRYLLLDWRREQQQHDKEDNDEDVMEGLKPHPNLNELVIIHFMGKMFASWMMEASQSLACLHNLVKIKFSNCDTCEQLPPLGHLPKLERVVIDGMSNIQFIGTEFYGYPESVGEGSSTQTGAKGVAVTKIFPSLRTLEMRNMKRLVKWSEGGKMAEVFPCLENLIIQRCSNLEAIPSHFQKVKKLEVDDIKSIGALGELSSLTTLRLLNIRGGEVQIMDVDKLCGNNNTSSLKELSMEGCDVLSCLRIGKSCVGLEKLHVQECLNIASIVISDVQLKSLKHLDIYGCDALENLPSELLHCCKSLENLSLNPMNLKRIYLMFEMLNHFPTNLISVTNNYSFSSLEDLTLTGLWNAKPLSGELVIQMSFPVLRHLTLDRFDRVEVLPHCFGKLPSLQSLTVYKCSALKKLPNELLQCCTSLKKLSIVSCPALVSLPHLWSPTLKSLKRMSIGPLCEELDHYPPMNIDAAVTDYSFSSLEDLTLLGWPEIKSLSEKWLQKLSFPALRRLRLYNFDGLEVIPDWLGNHSSLESLYISGCKNVVRFPELEVMQCLSNLQYLTIDDCPLLKEGCAEGSGAEWPKIAHVQQFRTF